MFSLRLEVSPTEAFDDLNYRQMSLGRIVIAFPYGFILFHAFDSPMSVPVRN